MTLTKVVSLAGTALAMVFASATIATGAAPDPLPQYTVYGPGAVTIPTTGSATPYPATRLMTTTDLPLSIAERMTVTIHGFTHTYPDDVWILLTNSAFPDLKFLLMGGCGGSADVNGVDLTFDMAAVQSLPDSGPIVSGVYRPTVFGTTPTFPGAAPAGPYNSLSTIQGGFPFNEWRLWVFDSASPDGGSIDNWSMTFQMRPSQAVQRDLEPNAIPAIGPAARYPATAVVSGVSGPLERVALRMFLTHPFPNDLDILLVAPDGRAVMVMSDVGGSTPLTNRFIEINDFYGAPLPTNFPATGTITGRPTNVGSPDPLPSPAPKGGYLSSFAELSGGPANGTWRLFAYDDTAPDGGTIIEWTLFINGKQFCPADHNRSGTVGVQDVFDFLSDFFATCP